MKEIVELNKRILAQAPGIVSQRGDALQVSRDGNCDPEVAKLPAALKAEINQLCGRLNEVVPNDFDYVLFLGNDQPDFMLSFCDGAMATASVNEVFKPEDSLFPQLAIVDWNRHRSFGMSGSQFFDGIRSLSKELEPALPSTAEIQRDFANELEDFANAKRDGSSPIFVLTWREDEGVTESACASMRDLRGHICDMMTLRYDIIGVIVAKKLLPPKKVDKLKREVLKGMKETMPISYAKALRVV